MKRRCYFCVYTFNKTIGAFVLEGVFSVEGEAVAMAKEINPDFDPQDMSASAVYVAEQDINGLSETVIRSRLDKLYEPLKKLAGISEKEPQWPETED